MEDKDLKRLIEVFNRKKEIIVSSFYEHERLGSLTSFTIKDRSSQEELTFACFFSDLDLKKENIDLKNEDAVKDYLFSDMIEGFCNYLSGKKMDYVIKKRI